VIASIVVALATAVVIVSGSLLPFLNPLFVGFEQRRAEAPAWTGYSDAELTAATDAILSDLVLGTGDFDVEIAGEAVLSDEERAHMRDVRTVFLGLWILTAVAVGVLVLGWTRARRGGAATRAAWRAAVRSGAGGLAVAVIGLGIVAVVAFDVLFEAFHRLLFPPGSYTFDPATQRLVQLFPFRFWQETAIAVGAVIVLVSGAVTLAARRDGQATPAPSDGTWSATEGRRAGS
jgi:integral membrane protein (TIGR01906 family)